MGIRQPSLRQYLLSDLPRQYSPVRPKGLDKVGRIILKEKGKYGILMDDGV